MTVIEVSTTVDVPPEDAYQFVLDFEGHADYSDHVRDVRRRGDGGVGTRFDIELSWWKLRYTLPTEVTGLSAPNRIEWRTPNGLHARGAWVFDPVDVEADGSGDESTMAAATTDEEPAATTTRITLRAEYDRARSRLPPMPPLVSVDSVLSRLKPVVRREARRVFEHAIADLEGQRRRVTLDIDVY